VELFTRKLLAGQEVPGQASIVLGVLSWNLFHGRDFPPDRALHTWRSRLLRTSERNATHVQVNRSLLDEFAGWIAARDWQLALLQEAPPRWFRALAQRSRAHGALALTSRNECSFARRLLAELNPDLIASGEGGSNQLLVRAPGRIKTVRRVTLAQRPERRRMLFAELGLPGDRSLCVANLHATASVGDKAAAPELRRAAALASEWAGERPLIFGGDLNVSRASVPQLFDELSQAHGLGSPTDARAIDHLLVRGVELIEAPRRLAPEERELRGDDGLAIRLSDHAPVVARFSMK
jgi:endonuclease/exonuclease/phosphatase family metal-dependent hydrolase